jgi:hypothetical protein
MILVVVQSVEKWGTLKMMGSIQNNVHVNHNLNY